ncbi:MAG: TonB-dependent receptor [Pseudomonadota bacterium]
MPFPIYRSLAIVMAAGTLMLPTQSAVAEPVQSCANGTCELRYGSEFFDRYAPVSALDMVRELPGFSLQDGDTETRGFAGSAGNILVNGERVSAKSEQPSDILSRIPAADVEAIILIRGQAGAVDLDGQTVIANVIRKGGGNTGTWSVGAVQVQPASALRPFSEASYSTTRGPLSLTASAELREYQGLVEFEEEVVLPDGSLAEFRDEVFDETGYLYAGAVQATLNFEKTKIGFNAAYEYNDEDGGETSVRTPDGGVPFTLFQGDTDEDEDIEVGADIERSFGDDLTVKLIGLYTNSDFRETGSLVRLGEPAGDVTELETLFDSVETETIARLETDFSGWEGHLIELSVEGAVNTLESDFVLLTLEDGALTPQPVPGAQTEVEEERVDFRLSDTFQWRSVSVEAALGGESSTITQTGGFEESRDFFFWKPAVTLSYAPNDQTQWRARALRDVGQLDFFDFVSGVDIGDDQLALGNPNLAPETTVTVDATYERRFGEIGVVSLTVYHDWIEDVSDVLPLDGGLEVAGNIGSGTRAGIRGEATFPLDQYGIVGGRLDLDGEWQTSSVTDPLTGEDRVLSGEREWEAIVEFRQDLTERRFAWGVTFFTFPQFPRFGLDERVDVGGRADFDAFIETRAIAGLRIRLSAENLLRDGDQRDRAVFGGPRNSAPLSFSELRQESRSRPVRLSISGTF